jgi:hypothetical protein
MSKPNPTWWVLPASVVSVVGVSVAVCMILSLLGIPFVRKDPVVEPKPADPIINSAVYTETPAMKILTASLSKPPAGWQGTGEILASPQAPYPYSCPTNGVNPVISLSKGFTFNGRPVQLLLSVYGTGLGVQGLADRFNGAAACAGRDAAYGMSALKGIGAESYVANTSRVDTATKTIIWRYGDIAGYLITEPGNPDSYGLAKSFNDLLVQNLNGACISPDISDTDLSRTPWSGKPFVGYLVQKNVEIPKLPLPTVPTTETPAYTATPIPAPALTVKDVVLPTQPTDYPVWPLLPTPATKPETPVAPSATAPFQKDIQVPAKDINGPGCGWAFTGTTPPVYDDSEGQAKTEVAVTKAQAELNTSAKQWQTSVLDYWKKYSQFSKAVPVWNSYADQVQAVTDAWNVIAHSWDTYNANKRDYDRLVASRNVFLKEQADAKTQYEKDLAQCKKQEDDAAASKKAEEEAKAAADKKAADDAKNNPNPTASPSPTATPSATPTPSPTPTIKCPVEKPAILDQTAPDAPVAPTPPADPRPANAR